MQLVVICSPDLIPIATLRRLRDFFFWYQFASSGLTHSMDLDCLAKATCIHGRFGTCFVLCGFGLLHIVFVGGSGPACCFCFLVWSQFFVRLGEVGSDRCLLGGLPRCLGPASRKTDTPNQPGARTGLRMGVLPVASSSRFPKWPFRTRGASIFEKSRPFLGSLFDFDPCPAVFFRIRFLVIFRRGPLEKPAGAHFPCLTFAGAFLTVG